MYWLLGDLTRNKYEDLYEKNIDHNTNGVYARHIRRDMLMDANNAERYQKYISSGLSEKAYLQSLSAEEREKLIAYLASLSQAVREDLPSQVDPKPVHPPDHHRGLRRAGKTQSSATLD